MIGEDKLIHFAGRRVEEWGGGDRLIVCATVMRDAAN